jgi:peptidyl-prolyl cis-trans isomerase B (cyclophilin B)
MPTKKQARAQQKRRQQQFEAKLAARLARRRRRQRAAVIAAGAILIAGGAAVIVATSPGGTGSADPSPTPSPTLSSPNTPLGFPLDYAEGREWTATLDTNRGTLTLGLDGALAPLAVSSFAYLADQGFFDGTSCHRLTVDDLDPETNTIFILQCGDPDGDGSGGPPYRFGAIENAPSDDVYPAGTVAMARAANDDYSMGSQFFIVYRDSYIPPDSVGGYTVFGVVTDGLDIVEAIAEAGTETGSPDGSPATPIILNEVTAA